MSKKVLSNKLTMIKKDLKGGTKKLFFTFVILGFIVALVVSPDKYITVALNGILVWATAILPALFPFMIFTKLLTSTGYIEQFSKGFAPVTKRLYKTPGISSYVFLMSIISGYPLGAKITADLYEEGLISRSEAHRICTFTSTSGPMFVVGTVGVGMLISPTAGYIMLISHLLAAVLNGLIFRKYNPKETDSGREYKKMISGDEGDVINKSMQNSIHSVFLIGGYITIFFVITEIMASAGIFYPIVKIFSLFGVDSAVTNGIIFGAFEVTKGCLTIASASISLGLKTIICSFIISLGGLSVCFQAFAFLNKFKISKWFFFLQKITHSLITIVLTVILLLIFPI